MQTVNIREAKRNLSRLIEQAANGEPFMISKAGKALVKVTPLDTPSGGRVRRLGFMSGRIVVPDDSRATGRMRMESFHDVDH